MTLVLSCLDPKNNVTSLLKAFGEIARLVKKFHFKALSHDPNRKQIQF